MSGLVKENTQVFHCGCVFWCRMYTLIVIADSEVFLTGTLIEHGHRRFRGCPFLTSKRLQRTLAYPTRRPRLFRQEAILTKKCFAIKKRAMAWTISWQLFPLRIYEGWGSWLTAPEYRAASMPRSGPGISSGLNKSILNKKEDGGYTEHPCGTPLAPL
jgi:hypothetical protein